MSETEKQEGQKTVISFISGLLIGGLLVWAFGGSPEGKKSTTPTGNETETAVTESATSTAGAETTTSTETTDNETKPEMTVGEGAIKVANQPAGMSVKLDGATYPADEGWIAVRSYTDGKMSNILGAARFSKTQGLVPEQVELLTPTVAGREYAVVFFSEDGNRTFNLSGDVQLEAGMSTFKAE